jgi:hypothetical protein
LAGIVNISIEGMLYGVPHIVHKSPRYWVARKQLIVVLCPASR